MNAPALPTRNGWFKHPSYKTLFTPALFRFYTSGEKKFRRISLDLTVVSNARRELRRFAKKLSVSDLCSLRKALRLGELNECVPNDGFVGTIIKNRKKRRRTARLKSDDYNHLGKDSDLVYWFKQHTGRLLPEEDDYVATTICWLNQIIKERRSGKKNKD